MSDPIQAIVRKTVTIAATFTGVPSPEDRARLRAAGAVYKNGQWVRSRSESVIVDEKDAAKLFEA
jgi:hypothetical protein